MKSFNPSEIRIAHSYAMNMSETFNCSEEILYQRFLDELEANKGSSIPQVRRALYKRFIAPQEDAPLYLQTKDGYIPVDCDELFCKCTDCEKFIAVDFRTLTKTDFKTQPKRRCKHCLDVETQILVDKIWRDNTM